MPEVSYVTRGFPDGTQQPTAAVSDGGVGNPGSGNLVLPWNVMTTAAATVTSGTLGLYPVDVWPAALSVKALACQVTTAQGTGGTGTLNQTVVYRDNGTGAGPLVTSAGLLASVAVTAPTTAAIKLLTVSLTLSPGRYWVGVLYYAGTVAPLSAPAYSCVSAASTLWATASAFTPTRYLARTGLTAVPTDGVAFAATAGTTAPIVGLQAT